jgi:hypothetical protein
MSSIENHIQFLYLLVQEWNYHPNAEGVKTKVNDTELRVVYWPEGEDDKGFFVIYGKRPETLKDKEYLPFRLKCKTIIQVLDFIGVVIGPTSNISLELHQYYGNHDESIPDYYINWNETATNTSTEIVAYDFKPIENSNETRPSAAYRSIAVKMLKQLTDMETLVESWEELNSKV